jgi:hypothetical protein
MTPCHPVLLLSLRTQTGGEKPKTPHKTMNINQYFVGKQNKIKNNVLRL